MLNTQKTGTHRRLETGDQVDEEGMSRVGDRLEDALLRHETVGLVPVEDLRLFQSFQGEVALPPQLRFGQQTLAEVTATQHGHHAEIVQCQLWLHRQHYNTEMEGLSQLDRLRF